MSRPLRILMVNYEYPPLGGGSGNATLHLLKELARDSGIRVDLITSGSRGNNLRETPLANVHIERIPIAKRENHYWTSREILEWFVRATHRTQSLVRENAYDLCHCWGGWPSGLIGSQHRRRMPYAVALRGSDVPGYNARLRVLDPMFLRPVSRPVWRNAAAVTCVSRFLRDLARETEPDIPYQVIHNGVDCSRFQPGTPPQRFTFLFVGRLIQRKGVGDLLEAFRTVARDVREPILRIVGGGPESARLAALHQDDALKQRVFFHGPADPESIPAIYRGASVFVMPSIEEAMSNATLEAMASGLPVITTRTGVSEIIEGNGIVVAKQSQSELVEAMHRYLAEPALASEHGRRSREIAETMTWGAVAKAYRDTYGRILSRATL